MIPISDLFAKQKPTQYTSLCSILFSNFKATDAFFLASSNFLEVHINNTQLKSYEQKSILKS